MQTKSKLISWLKINQIYLLLALILIFSIVTKSWRLYYPQEYIFDEVYVRFTAEEIASNNQSAWVWDTAPPKGFAYCWSHPQFGKIIMAVFVFVLGENAFSARVAPMIAGVLLSLITFYLSKHLFPKRPNIWLMSALFVALDGLVLVLSRIGLADTILTLFLLTSVLMLLKKRYATSAVFWGMAASIKWTSAYLLPIILLLLITEVIWKKDLKKVTLNLINILKNFSLFVGIGPLIHISFELISTITTAVTTNDDLLLQHLIKPELLFNFLNKLPEYFAVGILFVLLYLYLVKSFHKRLRLADYLKHTTQGILRYFGIGTTIYLASYLPFFLYGYSVDKFIQLQNQMYWYHTGLDATHPYQSPAFTWPLNIRPVWFWVDYTEQTIANIYALGNPVILWLGFLAVFITLGYYCISREKRLFYLLIAYFTFWLPWVFSPRIMFLYHYLPAIPYLTIILSFSLDTIASLTKQFRYIPLIVILLALAAFIFFFPYMTGIPVPKDEVTKFQWLQTWK